jgi:T-complex protein 1 subunit beta
MVDEAERSLHDALSVLSQTVKETRTVLGGGCSEMLMSCAVDEEARKVKGKKAIACEAFGRALRQIPTILADNAGYDSSDLVSRLRAAHYEGQADAGLGKDLSAQQRQFLIILHPDMDLGSIGSMRKLGITESYKLKRQVVLSASEAAEMIIRSAFSSFFPKPCSFVHAASTTSYGHPREDARRFEKTVVHANFV